MKIAVVCPQYGKNGGTGRVTTEVFERFARDGDTVDVFCGTIRGDGIGCEGFKVNSVNLMGSTKIGVLSQLDMLKKSANAFDRDDYDLVYAAGDFYPTPDIVTVHTLKHRQRLVLEDAVRRGVIPQRNGFVKRLARSVYMPLLYERGEKIVYSSDSPAYIFVSRGVLEDFHAEFDPTGSKRCVVIENGVDWEAMARNEASGAEIRARYNLCPQSDLALFAGSDWGRKRLDLAIEVVALAPGLNLLVVGHDDPAPYIAQAERLGCADRIVFAGFTDEIEKFYSAADYFLFTTVYETFGLVALEAMAAGCVVLSNPVNGCVDFIRDGENGFLCDFCSVESFSRSLSAAMADASLKRRISEEAIKTARGYGWESVYSRYRDVFVQTLTRKAGGSHA